MPNQKAFIPDSSPGMSDSDRNMQLSEKLAAAPNNGRKIVCITRDATDSGWELTYQTEV